MKQTIHTQHKDKKQEINYPLIKVSNNPSEISHSTHISPAFSFPLYPHPFFLLYK